MKKLRLLLITLCVSVLMGSMAVTAYAGGGEEWDGLAPVEPLPAETVDPGEGFTEDGNLVTRDLLYDKATNKQFITVQTRKGETYYLVIDYDKPLDKDGEQYETYFLNLVDDRDLFGVVSKDEQPTPEPTATPTPMPVIPQTDDVFPFALLSAAVFGSIVGFGIFAYKRRKSKPDESEH